MNETQFTEEIVKRLQPSISLLACEIASKKSVLYALSIDERGKIQIGIDEAGEPVRGGGTGFEQDILLFEKIPPVDKNSTSIIPRVIAEVKFGRVTTHDTITYSEKARRICTIYPFVRYGLMLGQMDRIPRRVLRLGQEFDFIIIVNIPTPQSEIDMIANLFKEELQTSRNLGAVLSGQKKIKALFRGFRPIFD